MDIYSDTIAGLYGVAIVVLGVFYLSFAAGVSPSRQAGRSRAIGGALAVFGAVLALVVFGAAQGTIRAPAAGVGVYLIMAIGAAMGVAGLGLYLGGVVAGRGRLAKWGATLLPVLIVGSTAGAAHITLLQEQSAFRTERAAFLSDTVLGTFAGHEVAIPVAPHYRITHPCTSLPRPTCHSTFLTGTALNDAALDGLEVFSVEALPRTDAVVAAMTDWCGARTEMEATVWCEEIPEYAITLRRSDDLDAAVGPADWTPVAGASDGLDIACERYDHGQTCKLRFALAEGVSAEVTFQGAVEPAVLAAASRARARSERLWRAMRVE